MEFTPLWKNPNYPELCKPQGFSSWRQQGVWYFHQLYSGSTLKAYDQLCVEFLLKHKQFYQYLQLRHAVQMQAQTFPLAISSSLLLLEIWQATARRGVISRAYSVLLASIQDHTLLKNRAHWVTDIGAIDGDQWDMAQPYPRGAPSCVCVICT